MIEALLKTLPFLGAFLLGSLGSKAVAGWIGEKSLFSRPIVIKRKGTNETATIPAHYDSNAVDILLKQLQK